MNFKKFILSIIVLFFISNISQANFKKIKKKQQLINQKLFFQFKKTKKDALKIYM